jgi:hypothetical protein
LVLSRLAIWAGAPFALSVVEGAIGILAQIMTCGLMGLSATAFLQSWLPGVRIALTCGLAALIGAKLAAGLGLNGAPALALAALPPAASLLLLQLKTVRGLLDDLFAARPTQFPAQTCRFVKEVGNAA